MNMTNSILWGALAVVYNDALTCAAAEKRPLWQVTHLCEVPIDPHAARAAVTALYFDNTSSWLRATVQTVHKPIVRPYVLHGAKLWKREVKTVEIPQKPVLEDYFYQLRALATVSQETIEWHPYLDHTKQSIINEALGVTKSATHEQPKVYAVSPDKRLCAIGIGHQIKVLMRNQEQE